MIDKTENPAEIYLVPVFDGEHDHVWCDTPAPGEGMREEDATRYVREDLVPASNDVLARRIAELTEKLSHHDYVIAQSENATGILCGNDMPGNSPLVLMAKKAMREKAELGKVIEHIAKAVGCEDDPMACWESVDALIHKAESLEQEAKIHASELDTQKSIVRDLCNLFGLRVHDYHCVSKVKEAFEGLRAQVENILKGDLTPEQYHQISNSGFAAEIKAQAVEDEYRDLLHVVANQYNGNDTTTWSLGANHVFKLFGREIWKRCEKLRQSAKAGA